MDIKRKIIQSIQKIDPLDNIEKQDIADISQWIAASEQIFRIKKPDVPNKHLVAFFAPYDPISQKVLLVHHKKSDWWIFPGGHLEVNETPYACVQRECEEELGIEAEFLLTDPFFIANTTTVGMQKEHIDVTIGFLIKCEQAMPINFAKHEFHDIAWYDLDKIPYAKSDPSMPRFISKIIATIAHK